MTNKKQAANFTMHYRPVQRIKYLPVKATGERKTFSLVQKSIYFYLYAWIREGKKAFPSLEELGDEMGCGRATVHRALDEMVAFGIVARRYQGRNKSCIYDVMPPELVMKLSDTIPENKVFLKKKPVEEVEIDWEATIVAAEVHEEEPAQPTPEAPVELPEALEETKPSECTPEEEKPVESVTKRSSLVAPQKEEKAPPVKDTQWLVEEVTEEEESPDW